MAEDDGIVDQVAGLRSRLEQLEETKRDLESQGQVVTADKSTAKAALMALRRLVQEGGSTGDAILDMHFIVTLEIERNDRFHRLQDFVSDVSAHAGELIVHPLRGGDYELAVIAASGGDGHPAITLHPSWFLAVEASVSMRTGFTPVDNQAILVPYQDVTDDEAVTQESKPAVGDEAVSAYLERIDLRRAVRLWSGTRLLGRPLTAGPKLAAEFARKREQLIPSLISAMRDLEELTMQLHRWQNDPAVRLNDRSLGRPHMDHTEDGVRIDFGSGPRIAAARSELEKRVSEGEQLSMEDNATFKEAKHKLAH